MYKSSYFYNTYIFVISNSQLWVHGLVYIFVMKGAHGLVYIFVISNTRDRLYIT